MQVLRGEILPVFCSALVASTTAGVVTLCCRSDRFEDWGLARSTERCSQRVGAATVDQLAISEPVKMVPPLRLPPAAGYNVQRLPTRT